MDLDELSKAQTLITRASSDFCQKNKLSLKYKLISEERHGSNKLFVVQVIINGKSYTRFENFSKRVARQKAAQLTLEELQKELG